MSTCDMCGCLENRIRELETKNEKLEEILLDAGKTKHRSKLLYDWYCKNTEGCGE